MKNINLFLAILNATFAVQLWLAGADMYIPWPITFATICMVQWVGEQKIFAKPGKSS